jgi:hypothetical protein
MVCDGALMEINVATSEDIANRFKAHGRVFSIVSAE